jgi:uncharacterized protein
MRIWDIHCHLPSSRVRGAGLVEQLDSMLEIAERVGIEKLGVFLRPTGAADREREIRAALECHRGRVFGFVALDLEETHQSVQLVERWIGDGPMIGIKLGGGSGFYGRPEYDPVFRRGVELKAVFYMHTWLKIGGDPPHPGGGNFPKESTPAEVVEVARRYPAHPFICGHTGGDWELGIRAVRASPNVSVEIGGGYPNVGQVEMAVRELGSDRVIYGSDVTGRSFSSQLGKVLGAAITDTQRQQIFSGNLEAMAAPILAAKGITLEWRT